MSNAKHEATVALLVAEVEFLKAHGWLPHGPTTPGGEVLWGYPTMGGLWSQSSAITIQRGRNVG